MLSQLRGVGYARPRGPNESTEFSISRFLVPWLSDFKGVSVFMDSDMLCLADVAELVAPARACQLAPPPPPPFYRFDPPRDSPAVWVVKHDYAVREGTKFLGEKQLAYPKKNWSSLMVFDNARCRALTPEYVARAPGLDLHRFQWLHDEDDVAELPREWNHLVGEYAPNPAAKILHYTLGGPWFPGCERVDHADLWRTELSDMTNDVPRF
jgi:hypothetical protein